MENITSGAQLATVRHSLGLSLKELAHELDINERTVRAWEENSAPINEGPMTAIRELIEDHDTLTDHIISQGGAWIPRKPVEHSRGWFVAAAKKALEENPGLEVEWLEDVLSWGEVKTERLTETDAWGETHGVLVMWVPLEITGYDAGLENIGEREWHLDGECPVTLERTQSGHVDVRAIKRRYSGTTELVVQSIEVGEGVKLTQGTHRTIWF